MILAIYCAGGLGREIIELARYINKWERIIFVDDVTEVKTCADADVFRFEEIEQFRGNIEFVIANGEPAVREKLYIKIKKAGYLLGKVIHPNASIWPNAFIGEGVIMYDATVSANAIVEDNVLLNGRGSIGHDVTLGAHSVLSHLSFVGGAAKIGRSCYIAPGAMIKDRVTIGDYAIVSLGAIVLRTVKPKSIMIGNPAKKIGENTQNKVFEIFS